MPPGCPFPGGCSAKRATFGIIMSLVCPTFYDLRSGIGRRGKNIAEVIASFSLRPLSTHVHAGTGARVHRELTALKQFKRPSQCHGVAVYPRTWGRGG